MYRSVIFQPSRPFCYVYFVFFYICVLDICRLVICTAACVKRDNAAYLRALFFKFCGSAQNCRAQLREGKQWDGYTTSTRKGLAPPPPHPWDTICGNNCCTVQHTTLLALSTSSGFKGTVTQCVQPHFFP